MEGDAVTTEREASETEAAPKVPTLAWVWPRIRSERLQGARLSIGRGDEAAIKLEGPGVSRLHAELYRQGPIYVIRDLGSTNGTWVGGRAIEHAPLSPGTVLRVGQWVGVFDEPRDERHRFGELHPGILGGHELRELLDKLGRAAPSSVPVLIIGETGTGKERLARAAHELSRRTGPFLAVNCAALPEQLAEAELFGYRRGAFTGAEKSSLGHFRAAHGGTLFLDEIADLSLALQAKLLRVVEDGQVLGLGESTSVSVDVRLVAASQSPLCELAEQGAFRRDLAARLTGIELRLPRLADRRADIAPLFTHFLKTHAGGRPPGVDARLVEALSLHDWPQNVRELELLTRTLLAVHGHQTQLGRHHLPPGIAGRCEERPRQTSLPARGRQDHDRARIEEQLGMNGGSVSATAVALGISRQRIYRLLSPKTRGRAASEGGGGETRD